MVLDGGSQTVDDLSAQTDAVADVLIGLLKVVVPGIFGVKVHEREDHIEVHDPPSSVFKGGIVKPGVGTAQLFVGFRNIVHGRAAQRRSHIAAVEGFESSDHFAGIESQLRTVHFLPRWIFLRKNDYLR